MRVLDFGYGVRGPARKIARFANVEIVGVNNTQYQVDRARKYTAQAGLENQVTFVKGDFMNLVGQFGPGSFDAVYAIEATCHAPSWEGCYGDQGGPQARRSRESLPSVHARDVLSVLITALLPSSRARQFGLYDWCMTDEWDASNPEHKRIAHGIEIGDGIPEKRSIAAARDASTSVGFEIEQDQDLADVGDKIP
ncbi:hypothetical protein CF328_g3285 [Tilletia controversa]|nr:hypothetical protein CF328_g3285 [Tilletia controversa]